MPYLDKKNKGQCREIGYISFFNFETAITKFRKHEYSKKCLLEKVHNIIFLNNIQNSILTSNPILNSTPNSTPNSTLNSTPNSTLNSTPNSTSNPTSNSIPNTNLTINLN